MYTDLQCLVNKIEFEEGLGNIEIFFMDTPNSRIGAAGHINLAHESIDVTINPEKKRKDYSKKALPCKSRARWRIQASEHCPQMKLPGLAAKF